MPHALFTTGGWIYIDRSDSRLRTERMHYGTRQKQVVTKE